MNHLCVETTQAYYIAKYRSCLRPHEMNVVTHYLYFFAIYSRYYAIF